MSTFFLQSPLSQFEVSNLLGLNAQILGLINFCLTNYALYILLTIFTIVGLHFYADNESRLIPNKWSISLESSFASFNSMVREQIGSLNEVYLPVKCFGKTLFRVQLSNSGDTLKLMIPSYIRKAISG
jgi:F-type H+-transporting ATPase subunit a